MKKVILRFSGPCLVLLLATLAGDLPAFADSDSPPDLSKMSLEQLLDVVVESASKSSQRSSEAPARIITITAEQIRRRGYMDLEEILHDLPGFDFNKGMGVNWSTIFMRGIRSDNSDRFLLIWDGVVQNDVWKQTTWISRQYPLGAIARIEVMYGPSSLLWGVNAFAGIINVILKKEQEIDGVSAWVSTGSFSTQLLEVHFGQEVGDWRFMMSGRYFESDEMDFNGEFWIDDVGRRRGYAHDLDLMTPGYADDDLADLDGDGLYEVVIDGERVPFDGRVDNASEDWFFQAGIGYKGLSLRALSWSRDESEDPWYTSQKRSKTHWIPTGSALELNFEQTLSQSLESKSYLIYRTSGIDSNSREPSFKASFTGNMDDPEELSIFRLGRYQFFRLSAHETRLGSQLNYALENADAVFGAELTQIKNPEDYSYRDSRSEPWIETPRHEERNLALFGNIQTKLNERFALAAGLRYDYNDIGGEGGGFGHLLTSRAAAIITPRENHVIKLIYGQSFQAPDAWHRFGTDEGVRDLPSPDLEPEKLQSIELTYGSNLMRRWKHDFSVYLTQIENLTRLVNVPFGDGITNQFQNIGSLEVLGWEWETRFLLDENRSVFLNASGAKSKDPETGLETGDIAPLKANLGIEWGFTDHLFAYLRGHYVAARDTVSYHSDSIYIVRGVDSYGTADLTLSWLDVISGLDLRLSIYNLFDSKYYDPGPRSGDGIKYNAAIVQEPIHAFLSLSYRMGGPS